MRGPRARADRSLLALVRIENLLHTVLLIARQLQASEHHRAKNSHRAARSARAAAPKASAWAWTTKPARTALTRTLRVAGLAGRKSNACQRDCYRRRTQAE